MAGIALTVEQSYILDEVALKDKWDTQPHDRAALEKRVLHKMWDGMSFERALKFVLIEVERPEDEPTEAPQPTDRESLILKVQQMKKDQEERFRRGLECK